MNINITSYKHGPGGRVAVAPRPLGVVAHGCVRHHHASQHSHITIIIITIHSTIHTICVNIISITITIIIIIIIIIIADINI